MLCGYLFSLSVKSLLCSNVTFSHIMSQTQNLLTTWCLIQSKTKSRAEEIVSGRSQRILTFRYCFYCNITRQEKWHRTTNGGREGRAGTDCFSVYRAAILNVTHIILGCDSLVPPEINLWNHFGALKGHSGIWSCK